MCIAALRRPSPGRRDAKQFCVSPHAAAGLPLGIGRPVTWPEAMAAAYRLRPATKSPAPEAMAEAEGHGEQQHLNFGKRLAHTDKATSAATALYRTCSVSRSGGMWFKSLSQLC